MNDTETLSPVLPGSLEEATRRLLAKATGTDAQTQVEQDLRRFKAIMEAGEFPSTTGQPQGGKRGFLAGEVGR